MTNEITHGISYGLMAFDALCHFTAGCMLAYTDYKLAASFENPTTRAEQTKNCLKAVGFLLDHQKPSQTLEQISAGAPQSQDSVAYGENVAVVRDYLITHGVLKKDVSHVERIGAGVRNFFTKEKLTRLSPAMTWTTATVAELAESFFARGYYGGVMGLSPIAAFATNTYQIPLAVAGLRTGQYLARRKRKKTFSAEEKENFDAVETLIHDTPIVELVSNYKPTREVEEQLDRRGIGSFGTVTTDLGRMIKSKVNSASGLVTSAVKGATGALTGENRRIAEKQAREATVARYEELKKRVE